MMFILFYLMPEVLVIKFTSYVITLDCRCNVFCNINSVSTDYSKTAGFQGRIKTRNDEMALINVGYG